MSSGVLFDVDGTLVDTNYLHALAWSRAFRRLGEWAPMNSIHRSIGMGGEQLVRSLLGHDDEQLHEAHSEEYAELSDDVRVIPGATELLNGVHDLGLVVVLATSAPAEQLDQLRSLLDVDDAIDATTCADDVDEAKPAPSVFTAACEAGGIDPERALVVGDSIWDVRAARAAGIACIGVETGGFSAHELREEGAVAVYRDVAELHTQIRTSPIAHLLNLSGS